MTAARTIHNESSATLAVDRILRELLKDRDMTASQLARATGISRKTLQNWLTGARPANVEQLKQVADNLSITLDELCFGSTAVKKFDPTDALPFTFGAESDFTKYEVTVRRL